MRFSETPLPGVWVVEPEPRPDERGLFARTWCRQEFAERGLNTQIAQCATSFNLRCGTLRGLHYQGPPHAEAKLVRCTQGAAYDVAVDLRPDSPTLYGWFAVEITAQNRRMLYVPEGCAHGFLTLADNTEIFYQMSVAHDAAASRGVRWDDPALAIRWPDAPRVMSERDRRFALISVHPAPAAPMETCSKG